MTLYRLKTMDDAEWKENDIQKAIDSLKILDHVINNMEQVAILSGLESDTQEGEIFTLFAQLFQSFRFVWEV